MSHAKEHGRFVWSELLTRDPAAAIDFYRSVLGWTTETAPMADGDYTMWVANGVPHGGLFPIPAGMEARVSWLPYVGVDDVDGATLRCQEEGGAVLAEPRDIPGTGRFAVLADPGGAPVAAYRAENSQPPAPDRTAVGEFSWRELAAPDIERACDFYAELFGWERGARHDMGPAGIYQLLTRAGGAPFAGVYAAPAGVLPSWTSYVRVADLDATAAALERHGGRIVVPPMEVPGGDRIAVGSDREGAAIGLHWIAAG